MISNSAYEAAAAVIELIHTTGGAENALKAVQAQNVPRNQRKIKKLAKKMIKTYIYNKNKQEV